MTIWVKLDDNLMPIGVTRKEEKAKEWAKKGFNHVEFKEEQEY
jgi:hypothetical protein